MKDFKTLARNTAGQDKCSYCGGLMSRSVFCGGTNGRAGIIVWNVCLTCEWVRANACIRRIDGKPFHPFLEPFVEERRQRGYEEGEIATPTVLSRQLSFEKFDVTRQRVYMRLMRQN